MVAFGFRSEQRAENQGFVNSLGPNALDALVSWYTFGFVGGVTDMGLEGFSPAVQCALRAHATLPDVVNTALFAGTNH